MECHPRESKCRLAVTMWIGIAHCRGLLFRPGAGHFRLTFALQLRVAGQASRHLFDNASQLG